MDADQPPSATPRPLPGSGGAGARSPAVDAALARSLFVIPSINGGALLRRMLPSLRLPLHTVVVLDQGSVDDTEAVCRAAGVRVVQLGHPHTYTEAGNIGAGMAREAGCDFLFISNNDIVFTTDVGAELLAEMLRDPHLGIVAPSQVIVDERSGQRTLAYRAEWHLDTMMFTHNLVALAEDVERLEADLCELTCAAIRMAAIEETGFLDNDYGFYYEDADLCFRLRRAGYSCAYLPRSQIEHYTSSTFSSGMSGRKRGYMAKNVELFASKHLGYGFGRLVCPPDLGPAASGIFRHLPEYLQRFGLLDRGRPGLVHGAPGTGPLDYLHVDWTDEAPTGRTFDRLMAYRGVVATSDWGRRRLLEAGLEDVGLAPVGVETDVFHPWAGPLRPFDETTLLWIGHGGERSGLAELLGAWRAVRADRTDARLIIMGSGVSDCLANAPASIRRWRGQTIFDYPEDGISVREVTTWPREEEMARLYRGVDIIVSTRLHPDSSLAAAMACGTLAVFSFDGSGRDLACQGALVYGGALASSAAAWRPEIGALASKLREALTLDGVARRDLARYALPLIRSRLTWRSTCEGLNAALARWQEPSRSGAALRRRWEDDIASLAATEVDYEATERPFETKVSASPHLFHQRTSSTQIRTIFNSQSDESSRSKSMRVHTRLFQKSFRFWRDGWSTVTVRSLDKRRAGLSLLGRTLSPQAKLRLKAMLARFGLHIHRPGGS